MMKPNEDSNPSVSLNFDAQALHNQDEVEYEREEQQRQQELRDLLTTEFDCDFTDEDEDGSGDSNGATSNDETDTSNLEVQPNQMGWGAAPGTNVANHMYGMTPLQMTSTPMTGMSGPPTLVTPAPGPFMPQHLQHGPGPPPVHFPMMDPQYQYSPHTMGPHPPPPLMSNESWQAQHQQLQQHHQQLQHQQQPDPQRPQLAYGQREEAEGGNEHQHMNYFDSNHQMQMHGYFDTQGFPMPTLMHPSRNTGGQGQQEGESAFMPVPSQQNVVVSKDPGPGQASTNLVSNRGVADTPPDLEGYKVTYRGNAALQHEQPTPDHLPAKPSDTHQMTSPVRDRRDDHEKMQLDFLGQGGATDSRQLGQLQILYDARGRKIEELTQEIKDLREDSDREIRILKHQLALTEDERDGMDGSLKQSQTLLGDAHRHEAEMQGKVNALESQVSALQQNKEELVKKLQTTESTIESLNAQLCELEKSETLSRARDHHNSIVTSMQHKFDAEIFDLKEKLDKSNRGNQDKDEEIDELHKKVRNLHKEMEEKQIERADTINRLSKSLENSQKQCEQMLEAGTGQELSKLKLQIQEVIAGKSIAEDMNSALTEELQDMKEQVMMYESASQFGILPAGYSGTTTQLTQQLGGATFTASAGGADDSYSQLNIKNNKAPTSEESGSNSSTPRSNVGDASLSSEQTLQGLKKELERCLTMYRNKRLQVTNLQDELRKTRFSLEEMTMRLDDAQRLTEDSMRKLSEYETEVGPLGNKQGQESVQERRLQRQIDALTKDKKLLEEEVNELMSRIEEIAQSEERLKEANLELGHQMAEMVKEYDEDKRQALEQCESTVLQHHERVKAQLEADLKEDFAQEKENVINEYEQRTSQLTSELDSATAELDEVKDLYITVCQSKEHLMESNQQLFHEKVEAKINEMMDQLQKAKEEDIKKLKETWSANNDAAIAQAKEQWIKEHQEEMEKQIDIKVELSKTSWLREYAGAKETAVNVALMDSEEKWKKRMDSEIEQKVSEALQEANEKWEKEKETEIKVQVQTLQAGAKENQAQTEEAIARKLEEAHEQWRASELSAALAEERAKYEEEISHCIEEAKQNWRENELLPALKEAKELANQALSAQDPYDLKTEVASMLAEAKDLWLEEQRQEVEATVKQVELAAAQEAQRQIDEATGHMQEELARLHEAKLKTEDEVAAMQAKLAEEKADVISSKDAERRQALLTAQDQCERDYRAFIGEHQDTLNKALKSARDEYAKEKAELERKHEGEIKAYKERELKMNQMEAQFNKEGVEMEQNWQQKLEEMATHHADEKDDLIRSHRENLLKALEEARQRWQQKYEEALEDSSALVNEKETGWEDERNAFQREIEALRSKASQQQDISDLKAEMERSSEMKITQLKATHQMDLQAVNADLRKQLDTRSTEMERLSEEVRACVAGLEEAQRVAAEEAHELKYAISQRDAEIARLKAELTASGQRVEHCETINTDVIKKLEDMQKQAEKIERDKIETEKDLSQINGSYHELVETLQKAERKVKNTELTTQKHVAMIQESMEREHSVAMEKMKAKMVELRSSHVIAMDNIRKQHSTEKKEWKKLMEQMKLDLSKQPDDDSNPQVTQHYMKTVTKMRAEVLRHVKESNARAAETVREQIVKERHNTARRLRRYYMKCLNHLLDAENQNMTREEKLAYMEQALEYIPSRDTSQLTSHSSGRSNVTTPDDLTPRNVITSSNSTATTSSTSKGGQSRSNVGYHSPTRPTHSASDSKLKGSGENSLTKRKQVSKDDQHLSYHHHHHHNNVESHSSHSRNRSGYKSIDTYEISDSQPQQDVPRLDLSSMGYSQSETPYNHVNKSSLKSSSSRRQRKSRLTSWESENSSGDNAHASSQYYNSPKLGRKEKHVVLEDPLAQVRNNDNSFTPGRGKYNLSSKSAEHFSIEKPRSSKSRSMYSDEPYDIDIEVPSMYKSQSTTCLEHSTPRGQYASDTEPRQYYDVDFGTFNSDGKHTGRERRGGRNVPLTKVNSETYLLTPAGLHGSMSMGDVRDLDESNQSLTEAKHLCRSDEGLLNCDDSHHNPTRRSNATQHTSVSGPLKSMSMPDVAHSGEHNWIHRGRNQRDAYYHQNQQYENQDSGDTTISESTEASPQITVRSKPRITKQGKSLSHHRGTYTDLSRGKKEQHVAFKNVDSTLDDEASDNDSVKSFLSTSSVSSFRNALKYKHSKSTPPGATSNSGSKQLVKSSGGSKPLKAPPPSEELQNMLAQVPDNVHRPVAMVTRHTQVPSPRTVYKLTQQFETRD